jgi:transcriptional regulator GlxA family with amidase domain
MRARNDMPGQNAIEIGLVLYPGTQLAAVLGMTDFLTLADRIAGEQANRHPSPPLRISHWQMPDGEDIPIRVFDTASAPKGRRTSLSCRPGWVRPSRRGRLRLS